MKRAVSFCALLFWLASAFRAYAWTGSAFCPSLSEGSGRPGEVVELSIPYDGSLGRIGSFLAHVEFDPEVFEYRRAVGSAAMREAYTRTEAWEDWVGSGYVQTDPEHCLALPGQTFTYSFRVREDAPRRRTSFTVSVYEILSPEGVSRESADVVLEYRVLPPPSREAALVALYPEAGELEPAFDPDWYDYTLSVPFEVTELTFLAEPADGAVCRANRKNLGAGGSDTEFVLTVTAEDRETKTIYRISVHRDKKAASPSPAPKPAASPGPEGGVPSAKPTSAPNSSAGGNAGRATPVPPPEQTASPPAARAVISAAPSVQPSGKPEGKLRQSQDCSGPAVVVQNGDRTLLPLLLILLIPGAGFLLSKPIAHWICGLRAIRFRPKEDPLELPEEEKDL